MSASLKHDYLHATPTWRKSGRRYDGALIQGPNGYEFVQIYALYKVSIHPKVYQVALVRHYHFIGRHSSSDYIQLEDKSDTGFIFVETIVRAVHILSPSTYNHFFTVQDLTSPDAYLRLLDLS